MTPGRNDTCPCGRRVRRALDEFAMASTMLPFVVDTYGPNALEEAWEEYSGTQEPFDPETQSDALNGLTPLEADRSARRIKPRVNAVTLRRVRERLGLIDD